MAKPKTKSVLICPTCGGFDVKAYFLEENSTKIGYANNNGMMVTQSLLVPNPQKILKVKCQNWPNQQQCGAHAEYPNIATINELEQTDPGIFHTIPNEYNVELIWKTLNIGSVTIKGTQHASLIVKCFDNIGHKYQFKGKSALEIVYNCKKDQSFKASVRIIKNLTSRYKNLSSFNNTTHLFPNGDRHNWSVKYYSQTPKLIKII